MVGVLRDNIGTDDARRSINNMFNLGMLLDFVNGSLQNDGVNKVQVVGVRIV